MGDSDLTLLFYQREVTGRLERLSDDDYRKAEEFVTVMKILYSSTICISAEKSATLGQILPILGKLQHHLTVTDEDRPSRTRSGVTSVNDTKYAAKS